MIAGGVDRHKTEDHGGGVTSAANDSYRVRITFELTVDGDGPVFATGCGEDRSVRWHLEGVNGGKGPFSCDIPTEAGPFEAHLGSPVRGRIVFDWVMDMEARETDADDDCGADSTGYASDTAYVEASWSRVQGSDGLASNLDDPVIPLLSKPTRVESGGEALVQQDYWSITNPAGRPATRSPSAPS